MYQGPDADEVPSLISELMTCLNDPVPQDQRPIQAGMAHLNLVMIHPFRDGNGRMARCLQSLVLARGGILNPVFISIKEYLGRNTQRHYDILAEVGRGSWQPGNDARPWVRFIITAHLRQARTTLTRIRESERLWIDLEALARRHGFPDRVLPLLFDAATGFRIRNATYRAVLVETGEERRCSSPSPEIGAPRAGLMKQGAARMDYGIAVRIAAPFADAVARVRDALQARGFGVLTEVDVQATLRDKLGVDMEPYLILGACNPSLAHQALNADRRIGLRLPCNVVVRTEAGQTVIEALDPQAMVAVAGEPSLQPVDDEAAARLGAALDTLREAD